MHRANEESDKGESITTIAVWFLRGGYILSTDRMDGYLLSASDRDIPLSQPIFHCYLLERNSVLLELSF